MNILKVIKKLWHFIWHDDSLLSWILNVLIAFILVKFVIYPGLGFVLQTTHPLVAVVSSSMEHNANLDDWWNSNQEWYLKNNIKKSDFNNFRLKNGFNKGDIMLLFGTKTKGLKVGDVIVFRSNRRDPIIHRIIKITNEDGKLFFTTKGDNNPAISTSLGEDKISEDRVVGKAVFRIPWLGWIKIGFVEIINLFR